MTPALILPVSPGQLAAIEALRGTDNLQFELLVTGSGIGESGSQQVQDTWRIDVPRSKWINDLQAAKARNILLLEVPLPLQNETDAPSQVGTILKRAEEHFRNGDYHACVASCRTVIQEFGAQQFGKKDWSAALLSRLATDRNNMKKSEREAALWAVLRHYTHQAHHAESEGGIDFYTRTEAQFILTLAASFITHFHSNV
jgi:hypothetical protein